MPTLVPTTIAGSLPKPEWLAPAHQLWAPWLLEGERLAEGKRDGGGGLLEQLRPAPSLELQRQHSQDGGHEQNLVPGVVGMSGQDGQGAVDLLG